MLDELRVPVAPVEGSTACAPSITIDVEVAEDARSQSSIKSVGRVAGGNVNAVVELLFAHAYSNRLGAVVSIDRVVQVIVAAPAWTADVSIGAAAFAASIDQMPPTISPEYAGVGMKLYELGSAALATFQNTYVRTPNPTLSVSVET
jgi:hypothetical protein